jgi:hypothetical protein
MYPVTDQHHKNVRSLLERNYANNVTFRRIRAHFLLLFIKYVTMLNQLEGKVHVMSQTREQKKYNNYRKNDCCKIWLIYNDIKMC